jgi:sugar-specific transcriptional regulator TrmB
MEPGTLEKIGLTQGESKVYLALLRLGSTKTGPLAKESGVSSSKVYKILDRLTTKGLAGYVVKGKVKYFTPMEPGTIIRYLEEEERKIAERKSYLKSVLPELERQHLASET